MEVKEIVNYLKRVEAMAKTGLTYSENPYDLERYEELKTNTQKLISNLGDIDIQTIDAHYQLLDAYPTPKVDVRGLVIKDGKVLMIQEQVDGKWSLPGGWCDIGYSPKENIEKEVFEESGLQVKAIRLLSVWDKKFHDHPPEIEYVYKLSFLCEIIGGELNHGHEALNASFFNIDELPDLSLPRNTEKQIRKLYQLANDASAKVEYD